MPVTKFAWNSSLLTRQTSTVCTQHGFIPLVNTDLVRNTSDAVKWSDVAFKKYKSWKISR